MALAESVAMLHALLDAASLASSGESSEAHRLLGPLARLLEGLAADLQTGARDSSLLESVAEALDVEIARWEKRAADDAEARAVLRAFLGVRELLWEFGVRRRGHAGGGAPGPARTRRGPTRRGGSRVQRVPVEG
jgi:septal ring factor EnvC (AmiA/AmiB activator)